MGVLILTSPLDTALINTTTNVIITTISIIISIVLRFGIAAIVSFRTWLCVIK
jgi:hypothetical protein